MKMCIWRYASGMSVLKYAMIYVILIEFTIERARSMRQFIFTRGQARDKSADNNFKEICRSILCCLTLTQIVKAYVQLD